MSNSKISEVTWWKSFPCDQGQLSGKKTRGSFCIFRKACLAARILPTRSCSCSGAEAVFLPLLPKFVEMAPNSLGPRGLRGFFQMHLGAHVGLLSLGGPSHGVWLAGEGQSCALISSFGRRIYYFLLKVSAAKILP